MSSNTSQGTHERVFEGFYFVKDLAALLGRTEGAIRKMLRRNELGPHLIIGNRLAVRKKSFWRTMERKEDKS